MQAFNSPTNLTQSNTYTKFTYAPYTSGCRLTDHLSSMTPPKLGESRGNPVLNALYSTDRDLVEEIPVFDQDIVVDRDLNVLARHFLVDASVNPPTSTRQFTRFDFLLCAGYRNPISPNYSVMNAWVILLAYTRDTYIHVHMHQVDVRLICKLQFMYMQGNLVANAIETRSENAYLGEVHLSSPGHSGPGSTPPAKLVV
jgi:hypothetical protein